ncbi:MAG TPA: tRNA pseudouridine(13) synthase TruD [Candidatus Nanoarchaeia archaeon]|nr:tRNA pseudouridine(13) synthase TruD [Candidatus Nanoarchaeia archaeon]
MKLKQLPEDFYVQEIYHPALADNGCFACFLLKKKEWGTLDALSAIATALHADIRRFGIAGMKDKRGITEQYVSGYRITKSAVEQVKIRNIELTFLGYLKERITLGELEGNHFRIVVRDLAEERKIDPVKKILNLFDYQRFGKDMKNIEVGRAFVQGDYNKVCEHLKIDAEGNDYIGALRKVNRRILRFLVSSYQSHLWNEAVQQLKSDYAAVPILGYLTELKGEVGEAYKVLMENEEIKQENFLMKSIPELSSEGNERKMFVELKNFSCTWGEDNHNKNNYKCILEFDLGKGQYATHVVKTLFQ